MKVLLFQICICGVVALFLRTASADVVLLSDIEQSLQIKQKNIDALAALRQVGTTKNRVYDLNSSEFQTFADDDLRIKNEYTLTLQQLKFGDFKRAIDLAERALSSKSFSNSKTRLAFVKLKFEALRKNHEALTAARYCGNELNQFVDANLQSAVGDFSLSCAQVITQVSRLNASEISTLTPAEIHSFIYSVWNARIASQRLARQVFFSSLLAQLDRVDDAIALVDAEVKLTPVAAAELPRAYLMLGELYAKKGDFSAAKDVLAYLAKLNKKSRLVERELQIDESAQSLALLSLARLFRDHNDAQAASETYELVLKTPQLKDDKEVLLESAVVLHSVGKIDQSLERFSKVKEDLLQTRAENTNFGIPEFIEVMSQRKLDESQALAGQQIAYVQQDLRYLLSVSDRFEAMGANEVIRTGRAVVRLQDVYQSRSPFSERLALLSNAVDKSATEIRMQRLDTLELLQLTLKSEDVFARKEREQLNTLFKQFADLRSTYESLNRLSLSQWSEALKNNKVYSDYLASIDRKMSALFEDEFAKEVFNRRQATSNGAFWHNVEKAKQALEENRQLFIKIESARVARELSKRPRTTAELELRSELQQQNQQISELFRELALFRLQTKNVISADDNAFTRRRMKLASKAIEEVKNLHARSFARTELSDEASNKRLLVAWEQFAVLLKSLEEEVNLSLEAVDSKKKRVVEETLLAIRQQDLQERDLTFVKKRLAGQFTKLLPTVIDSVRANAEVYKGRLTIAANQGRRKQLQIENQQLEKMQDDAEVRELWLKSLESDVDSGLIH